MRDQRAQSPKQFLSLPIMLPLQQSLSRLLTVSTNLSVLTLRKRRGFSVSPLIQKAWMCALLLHAEQLGEQLRTRPSSPGDSVPGVPLGPCSPKHSDPGVPLDSCGPEDSVPDFTLELCLCSEVNCHSSSVSFGFWTCPKFLAK